MAILIKSKSPLIDVSKLKPYHKNRNKHSTEQIEKIAELIRRNGMRDPLSVCEDTMEVITGNGTFEACKLLGMKKVPCDVQKFKNEKERFDYSISHNAVSRWSDLNMSEIKLDLKEWPDLDLDLLGIKNFEKLDTVLDDFEEPEPKDGPSTKETELIKCPNCGTLVG